MQLMTSATLEALISQKRRLKVKPFDRGMLQHTCYYLRLGSRVDAKENGAWIRRADLRAAPLVLQPRSFVRVWTVESIALSNDIFAVFGQISDLIEQGLILVHSPFIDPLFEGPLRLGLHNLTDEQVTLMFEQPIAKVSFFDVTESNVSAPVKGSIMDGKLQAFRRYIEASDISPFPPEALEED